MTNDQPRTPAGSPEGGQFAGFAGAESTASLIDSVGARVDNELRCILEQVMVERHLGDPTNPSDEETIRAAIDYMGLPDFDTPETQARWALEDVKNAAEVDLRQVRGQYADEEFVHERLDRGEMVPVEYHDGTMTIEGEAFRSSTTGKVWFVADNPYPDAYRGDRSILSDKLMNLAMKSRAADLNTDPNDEDNDYDLIHEAAQGDEDVSRIAWDYALTFDAYENSEADTTLRTVIERAKGAVSVPMASLPPIGAGGSTVTFNGREVFAFRNSARPDHVWVIGAPTV